MGSDPEDRDDPAALRARLDRLSGELKGRAAPPPAPEPKREAKADGVGSAMSLGLRAGSEFVSAVIVGLGIGWVLDRALGTNPAFLIVFFLDRRRGRGVERNPADFAQSGVIQPQFALVSPELAG